MSEDLRVGLFPVRYTVGTGAPGAPQLKLNLLVFAPESSVAGTAAVTQVVSPPSVEFHADVWGTYLRGHGPAPGGTVVHVSLTGNDGGPHSNSILTFHAELLLAADGRTGVGTYRYFYDGSWRVVEHVPVKIDPELVPFEPGPVIDPGTGPVPLYGVGLQAAAASGSLSHMQTLAAYARQQLSSRDEIAAGLDALKAEISKLEGRH
ncbi:DUF1842 domain-containing protein [Burkholderia alba]|uniref:DUF1842 domain-containing protein n=1 Tax=Burkholderia alba TaxID=2683677 RepID=UPI002B0529B7|nr:DUF1842 domain-containing protein [Burkholderia alba]